MSIWNYLCAFVKDFSDNGILQLFDFTNLTSKRKPSTFNNHKILFFQNMILKLLFFTYILEQINRFSKHYKWKTPSLSWLDRQILAASSYSWIFAPFSTTWNRWESCIKPDLLLTALYLARYSVDKNR